MTSISPLRMQQMFASAEEGAVCAGKPTIKIAHNIHFTGVVGSDNALSYITAKHAEDIFGTVMVFPVESFVVAKRKGDDLTPLRGEVGGRPITKVIHSPQNASFSST